MSTMTTHDMDEELQAMLRLQAAQHGRSMEEEARNILRAALAANAADGQPSLLDSIRARVEPLGGVELVLPQREPIRSPQDAGR